MAHGAMNYRSLPSLSLDGRKSRELNIKKYYKRIGFKGKGQINEGCLKELHRCHVLSIPFEAIDVQMGKRIDLKLDKIYNKVINQNRGGYCYELNLLFHEMLTKIGFGNYLISARIFDSKQFGPEFDHMAIIVKLKEQWLVDVGFGDLFLEPIQIATGHHQDDTFKTYKITKLDTNEYVLSESLKGKSEYIVKYMFSNIPRTVDEFDEQNNWKQTSKDSYFVKNTICTLPTEDGRKTILNNIYKSRIGGKTEQVEFEGETKFIEILKSEFNIVIQITP